MEFIRPESFELYQPCIEFEPEEEPDRVISMFPLNTLIVDNTHESFGRVKIFDEEWKSEEFVIPKPVIEAMLVSGFPENQEKVDES